MSPFNGKVSTFLFQYLIFCFLRAFVMVRTRLRDQQRVKSAPYGRGNFKGKLQFGDLKPNIINEVILVSLRLVDIFVRRLYLLRPVHCRLIYRRTVSNWKIFHQTKYESILVFPLDGKNLNYSLFKVFKAVLFTETCSNLLHSGRIKYQMPSAAPGRVTPRTSSVTSTT